MLSMSLFPIIFNMTSLKKKIAINNENEKKSEIKKENCIMYFECKFNFGSKIDKSYLNVEKTNKIDKKELKIAKPPNIDGV
jgi:hypothetical protein